MQRSHRSYKEAKPFSDFERKARIKKSSKDNKSLFANITKFLHRTSNK